MEENISISTESIYRLILKDKVADGSLYGYLCHQGKKYRKRYDYPFYATYHGVIETNFGIGHVYDLIRDETTQNRSLTLSHYREMTSLHLAT